jgi:hypothetical protein
MLGSDILDVMIGLVLVYCLLSLVLSTVRELIESCVKSRGVFLEQAIRNMLGGGKGSDLAGPLYSHPLIASLFRDGYAFVENRKIGRSLPNYIPSNNFSTALMDLVVNGTGPLGSATPTTPLSLTSLRAAADKLDNPPVKRALIVAIDAAGGELATAKANIEAWFDSTMERVSGWYRRRTQLWLFCLAIALVGILNVNTIVLADHLSQNKAQRELLVGEAAVIAKDSAFQHPVTHADSMAAGAAAKARFEKLNLPVGWSGPWQGWPRTIAGLLITAIALTLGAPFWFDLLSKMMTVRSTVKPKADVK